jgi:cell wall-associated NlpC family hydrolase
VVSVVFKFIFIVVFGWLCGSCAFASQQPDRSEKLISQKPKDMLSHPSRQMKKVVGRAHQLIGAPYRWGGTSVSQGFDCSGLLVYLFRSEAGVHLPRTTASMLQSKARTIARNDLKSGDAVFFKHNGGARIKHVGLYIGNGRFIHAPRTGKTIRIDSLSNRYWASSYLTAKRFH